MNTSSKFLQGGGRMGELIRNMDWTQTVLGSPDTWPDSLKAALSICLNSGFPIAIYWGEAFTLLYNDAWSSIPGDKHPWALGRAGREVWPELWDGLDAQFKSVLTQGESIRVPDALLLMHRYGYTEECYFDYTLSPITDVNGQVGGVFNAVIETTYRVINERRNHVLHGLMQHLVSFHSFTDAVQQTMQLVGNAKYDIPFSLLYTAVDSEPLKLTATTGIEQAEALGLQWTEADIVLTQKTTIQLSSLPHVLQNASEIWPELCSEALIVPLSLGDAKIRGYLVVGISPRKRLDADYQHFIEAVAIYVGTAINNGYAHEQEQLMYRRIAESENRFRSMMHQSPVAMAVLRGADMVVAEANTAMLTMLGKEPAIIGLNLLDALPHIKDQPYVAIINNVYQTGKPYYSNATLGLVNRHGSIEAGYFNSSYTPLIEDGKITGVLVAANEVTEQVNAQRALEESEALLRNITTASPAILWMADGQGMITYVNQTWTEWTGMSFEESLGTGWTKAILEEDRHYAGEKFFADIEARRYYEVSFRINKKNGGIAWCLASGHPNFDREGNFNGYIGTCVDITEKIQSEQQLAKANQELQSAVTELEFLTNSIPTIIWTSKPNGEIDFINRKWYDRNSAGMDAILGSSWINNVHPDDKERVYRAWMESVNTGNKYETEFRIKGEHGDYRWYLVRALPMRNSSGEIIKWYGTDTDIHEQKVLEQQKDNFLGVASHELKTPVTSIKAYAQVLENMLIRAGDEQKASLLNRLNGQIDRLINLIADLLDVTKINTGRLQFNEDYFNFNTMLEEIIEDMQRTALNHTIEKDLLFNGEIYGDRDRISQVIINLLTNAIKYSPDATRVMVRTEVKENELHVSVQDFGIGIRPDQSEHVFEQFYRVSGSKENTFSGLGLGLYISAEIIKRAGGRIWVNSVLGEGSTFCFSLPLTA